MQLWEEGYQPKCIQTDAMMLSKIAYIHENPVKRRYVDVAMHWRYSSARDYEDVCGLLVPQLQLWNAYQTLNSKTNPLLPTKCYTKLWDAVDTKYTNQHIHTS